MTRIATFVGILASLLAWSFIADAADVHVRGYTTKNGTYVEPHYRSAPNNNYNDNWSVRPNVNPYTGAVGTRSPTPDGRPPQSPSIYGPSIYGNPYPAYGR